MSLWQRLLNALGFPVAPRLSFHVDVELIKSLQAVADQEQRRTDEVANALLSSALAQLQAIDHNQLQWQALTPREQDVTALICLGFTNRAIADHLEVSPETIKTHVRHILHKYAVSNKVELRQALEDWDFSAWVD